MRRARQREQLILALLQQPGIEKAAAVVGISTVTAWRITKTPEFKEAYRQARRDAFTQSLGRLQQAAGAATSTLMKIMVDATAPAGSRVPEDEWQMQGGVIDDASQELEGVTMIRRS